MTTPQLFTTPQVRRILGIRARQTLYNWGVTPDKVGPGERGVGLYYRSTILQLAKDHNRTVDWDAA